MRGTKHSFPLGPHSLQPQQEELAGLLTRGMGCFVQTFSTGLGSIWRYILSSLWDSEGSSSVIRKSLQGLVKTENVKKAEM